MPIVVINGTDNGYALGGGYVNITPGRHRTSVAFFNAYLVPELIEHAAKNVTGVVITGTPKAIPDPGGDATKVE